MKIAFLGSKALGLNVLKSVYGISGMEDWQLIHPFDENDTRSCLEGFAEFAQQNSLEFSIAKSQASADKVLIGFQPDIVLVCGWYWLISRTVLQIPHLGIFGVHTSLLPKYRGGSPLVWSILNGDRNVGATVFQFTDGIDEGRILSQVEVPLEENDNVFDALKGIEKELLSSFPATWTELLRGTASLTTQDESSATYCGQRIPDDGHIDWRESAKTIHDFVRAQSMPYPGAFCYTAEIKITIWKTEIDHRVHHGTPGQVLWRMPDHI